MFKTREFSARYSSTVHNQFKTWLETLHPDTIVISHSLVVDQTKADNFEEDAWTISVLYKED